jgi:hypothetical protein
MSIALNGGVVGFSGIQEREGTQVKKTLLLALLLGLGTWATADEITFSIRGDGSVNITSGTTGMVAMSATAFEVADITTGKVITIDDAFSASAGSSTSIHVTPASYTAFFSGGMPDSVSIAGALTGTMDPNSELTATLPGGAGSFSGEFDVTSFNQSILDELGVKGKVGPSGSVGITFVTHDETGNTLTGVIGGGSTTVLTVQTAIPEPDTIFMFAFGAMSIFSFWYLRQQNSTRG